jgi:DNA-binding NtrC family response regulator
VLEARSFFRVGGVAPIKVDVRVVAATNRSLRDQVGLGRFRDDLYYRLNVLSLYLPPLRERREDIPLLVRRFIREFSAAHDRSFHGIAADAMALLVAAPWPGNVRQLRNLIESMVVLAPGGEIRPSDIPPDILEGASRMLPMRIEGMGNGQVSNQELEFILRSLMDLRLQVEELRHRLDDGPQRVQVIDVTDQHPVAEVEVHGLEDHVGPRPPASGPLLYRPGMTMAEVERAAIEAALREHEGNRRKAAEELGIGERTLYRKLKAYGLG